MFNLDFSVKRERYSTTQGEAVVYINNHEIARFHDRIELIGGSWKSVQSDEVFINGVLSHPLDDLYQISRPLKDYLVKTHQIQKVSCQELSLMFDRYFDSMKKGASKERPVTSEGLFYAQSGDRFVSFKHLNGECDARDFTSEVHALCWLAA